MLLQKNKAQCLDKQKGIYVFTTYANLDAMQTRGWLEVAIGDAGLKKEGEGDIDSRITGGLSNSKFPSYFKVEIDRILNPGHRDTALHKIIRETTASQMRTKDGKGYYEIFRFPVDKNLIDLYGINKEHKDVCVSVAKRVRNSAGKLNSSLKKKGVVLRNIQQFAMDKITEALLNKGVNVNIVCELAPRIGKTILFLELARQSKETHEAMFVKAYGVGLSVKTSYETEINTWSEFDCFEFVDASLPNAEQLYKQALKRKKMPVVFVSLNPEDYENKYKWINKLKSSKGFISLLEETDFGVSCDNQVKKIAYLIENKDVTRINSSGTNIGKIAKAMGGDSIDEIISIPYCMVEQDTSIKDRVLRKFYDVTFSAKINKLLEKYEDEDLPNMRKILEKPQAQKRFLKALFQDLYDEETIYGLSIDEQAGEEIKTSMVFLNSRKKAMDQLAKLIEVWLPEHKVLVLHGDHTNNKNAEGLTKQTLIELQTGVHGKRDKLIILSNMMGSRSYTIPEIQACLFLQDGGDLFPFNQKYSRCLSPWTDANGNILKKFGHIFMFGFDTNKTKQYELAVGVEASQLSNLTKKTLPDSIMQVMNSVAMKDVLSGKWLDASDIIKKFEDCNKLLDVANAGTKITLEDLTQDELEAFGELAKGFSTSKSEKTKIDKTVKTGKTFNSGDTKKNSKKKEPLLVIVERAIKRLNASASTVIEMTNYKGKGFLDCLKTIEKSNQLSKEFTELYGIGVNTVLKLSSKLQISTLDMIIYNTINGNSQKNITNNSQGIVADGPELWREILSNRAMRRKLNSNKCKRILVVAGGLGTEIDVLVELYGIDILNKIMYNDKYTHFCNRIKKKYPQLTVMQGDFLELEIDMKFDVVVGNPPYTQGKKFLYRYFFEKSLELSDKVAMVMPLSLHSKYDSLKELNKLVKTHNEFISENVSHHFNVGLNNIHYVVASKDTYNKVDSYYDLLDNYKEIYPDRKRLEPTLGNTPVGFTKNYDDTGKLAVVKVLQDGPDIRKVKIDVVNKAKQKTIKPYVVFHNNAPSLGKFNVYLHETKNPITWSQHVFAYQFDNKEDAKKLADWLQSNIITQETKKMLELKKKHTISLEMLRKLPWYE